MSPRASHGRRFIEAMRTAMAAPAPIVAAYNRGGGYTHFRYTVSQGGNLYLTAIFTGAAAVPAAGDPVRPVAAGELAYGGGAVGPINLGRLQQAFAAVPPGPQGAFGPYKNSFDVVLLTTIEAVRSRIVYSRVLSIITGGAASGDEIKDLAQMYDHTRGAAGLQRFKALDSVDYLSYYKAQTARGNVVIQPVLSAVALT